MVKLITVELAECDKCGARDWKIYTSDLLSQEGDGCFHCKEGILTITKKIRWLYD